ncbi:MAG: 3-hydroxyacyl-CoA dehydrogenase NAD-binding domain-containing protein, partial [Acetobacteraceae bacterium]
MNVETPASLREATAAAPIGALVPLIAQLGVIGAGQMGNGIAHVAALAGLPVTMLDVKAEALEKAMATMARNMERQVNRKLITPAERDAGLARVTTTTDYAAFAEADLVIEAATEKEEVKRAVFRTLVPHLKPSCMLASNTSSISITRLGAATDRPEKFIGMHFMNPVPVMKLVEIIRGIATDEPTFQAVDGLARRLGKTTAVAEDFPAFIVNRILVPMINEAVYALYEGVGSVTAIDTSMKLGANHPMGPLELADFI